MHKVLAFLAIGLSVFLTEPVLAQSKSTIPEFNALCWREQQCFDVRAKLLGNGRSYEQLNEAEKKLIADGFDDKEEPCTGGSGPNRWGKCLPASTAKTMIAFGGKREFVNIGDFIRDNYTFALSIAAILAVIMIIVAGFQWVTSGGNSESISSAKNRIGGALIGLFIAYTSYFILNTISPNLVNLRLPQTWMVRPLPMVPQFCVAAPTSTMFHFAAGPQEQGKTIEPTESFDFELKNEQTKDINLFACGSRFYMKEGGNSTCFGNICKEGEVCANFDDSGNTRNKSTAKSNPFSCIKGTIAGIIIAPSHPFFDTSGCTAMLLPGAPTTLGWQSPDPTDPGEQELWAICKNGANYEVPAVANTIDIGNGQQYIIAASKTDTEDAVKKCGDFAGFVLTFEMQKNCNPNDQTHVIGRKDGKGIDLGPDNFFPIDGSSGNFLKVKGLIDENSATNYSRFLIPLNELGGALNIDADDVHFIGSSKDLGIYIGR